MEKQKIQKQIESLLDSGQVVEVHHLLNRYHSKSHLNPLLLYLWAEIVATTECAPLKVVLDAAKLIKMPRDQKAVLDSYLFVDLWCRSDWRAQEAMLMQYQDFVLSNKGTKEVANARIHFQLCTRLLAYCSQHPAEYNTNAKDTLAVIGDSHGLVPNGKVISWDGRLVKVKVMPIRGIKMYHLGNKAPQKWKSYFREKIRKLPPNAAILLSIGEIDCRPNEGIYHAAYKNKGPSLKEILDETIMEFVTFVRETFESMGLVVGDSGVTLMGVSKPRYDVKRRLPEGATEEEFVKFIESANTVMLVEARRAGWAFLDVYAATQDASQGEERNKLYLDEFHLSPRFYDKADNWRLSNILSPTSAITPLKDSAEEITQTILQAIKHHQAGRLTQASEIYQQVIQVDPDSSDALHLLGVIAHQEGNSKFAIDLIGKAIRLAPSSAMYYNLGLALTALGELTAAIENYRMALEMKPDYAEAHYSLGFAFQEQGMLDAAASSYRKAIVFRPNYAVALNNLGIIYQKRGQLESAAECYSKAIASKPEFAEAFNNLADVQKKQGLLDLAIRGYQQAISLKPEYASAYNNLGTALQQQGKADAAAKCYGKALSLNPGFLEALNNMGALFKEQGNLDVAVTCYQNVLKLNPDFNEAHGNLANAFLAQGKLNEAIESYRKALSLKPTYVEAHSNLLFALSFYTRYTSVQLREEAAHYGRNVLMLANPYRNWLPRLCEASRNDAPLRIGLVSGDLRKHPVGYFVESILSHLNPRRIELIAYPTKPQEDELTARIKQYFRAWRPLMGLNDEAAAKVIHDDGVQVLIDLAGHTAHNRLPIFAWKPAPVQVSWLGYFATTGVPGIDYVFADRVSVPELHQTQFTEEIWYLPDTRLCFTPPDGSEKLLPSLLPAIRNGYITFGCFQSLMKLNEDVLVVWGEIFRALPQARLRLQNKQLTNSDARESLQKRLSAVGITPERLIIVEPVQRVEYLSAYAEVDIILDTFPYPGGTTTCEALWMGVPILTLIGETMLSRQGASLLSCAGLENWIARDRSDYVARALSLASDIPMLMQLRAVLRQRVLISPLFDASRFAKNLDEALHGMWQEKRT